MTTDPVFRLLLAAVVGFGFKIIYDWLVTGRLEKGVYVKTDHCDQIRKDCCLPQIKIDVGVLKEKTESNEKAL